VQPTPIKVNVLITFYINRNTCIDLIKGGYVNIFIIIGGHYNRPPLWSSGQSSWLQIQRSRVRFPALPDFLRNSGSGTGSTQPREDN
jgi:hypothetical protein